MITLSTMMFQYPRSGFHLDIEELTIARGERVALAGPSGSGKTTLLNLLAGILIPNRGTIRMGETPVPDLPDAARRQFRIRNIGFVFQSFELVEYLNVIDNVLLPCRINPALPPNAAMRERAAALVDDVGLHGRERSSIHDLSHGEKQRVAIARAMLNQPRYLLADEPTGNLDPANKEHIVDLLLRQCEQTGATLLMVTHDHELLTRFSRVIDFRTFLARGPAGR